MVFKKKADFEDKSVDDDAKKKSNNKIPKRIRTLMKRKKKLSKNILASTSWQKNYKTMVELRQVEDEIDEEYKKRRLKEEKAAIQTIKQNPKYFYSYAKKFSKSKGEIAAFEKEDGVLTDDPAEQAEILRRQYESVASKPFEDFKVNDDFFMQNEEVAETNAQTCKTDVTVAAPFVLDCIDIRA